MGYMKRSEETSVDSVDLYATMMEVGEEDPTDAIWKGMNAIMTKWLRTELRPAINLTEGKLVMDFEGPFTHGSEFVVYEMPMDDIFDLCGEEDLDGIAALIKAAEDAIARINAYTAHLKANSTKEH